MNFIYRGLGEEPLPILSIFIKKQANLIINFGNVTAIVYTTTRPSNLF